jgi:hypothetical protein
MRRTKQHVMALTFCTAALFAGPVLSNSLHDEGDFGGGFAIIGPSGGPERYDYVHKHTFRPYYDGPSYSYYDGPAYDYVPEYYDDSGVLVLPPAHPGIDSDLASAM